MATKKQRNRNIGIVLVIIVGIILALQFDVLDNKLVVGDISEDAPNPDDDSNLFTPIFCNDYEFTCCNIKRDSIGNKVITDESGWMCPNYAYECNILSVFANNVAQPQTIWKVGHGECEFINRVIGCDGFKCNFESTMSTNMQPGDFVWLDHCVLNSEGYAEVKLMKQRLDFTGPSAALTGVPVRDSFQCHFEPEKGKIYSITGGESSQLSYTVPAEECVLSYQQGNRHICGYKEESCDSDNDCGGHTFGNQECIGRTLQTYGCRNFGTPTSLEKDRRAGLDSDFGNSDSYEVIFGKRCEVEKVEQVSCCGDTNCGTGFFCDVGDTWTCKENVGCDEDSDCGVSVQCDFATTTLKTPFCNSGSCDRKEEKVDCCSSVNCPTGEFCNADYECEEGTAGCKQCPYECCEDECKSSGGFFDRECPDEKPICTNSHECVADDGFCDDCFDWLFSKFKEDSKSCESKTYFDREWYNPMTWILPEDGITQDMVCPIFLIFLVAIAGLTLFIFVLVIQVAQKGKKGGKKKK